MPLRDHFHKPFEEELPWCSMSTLWTAEIVKALNHSLPRDRYRAYANKFLGSQVAADVAEYESMSEPHEPSTNGAVALASYTTTAMQTMPALFPDDIEILIKDSKNGRTLVAVIELVSPSNKKEASEVEAFVSKCAAYLQKGIGLLTIDIVTERKTNLHDELIRKLGRGATYEFSSPTPIYAAAYRPVYRKKRNEIDLWKWPLQLDAPLPIAALPLKGGPIRPLDLEATYAIALDDGGVSE